MIVQQQLLLDRRSPSSKNLQGALETQLQFQRQLPVVIGNLAHSTTFSSPKVLAGRRTANSQEKKISQGRLDKRLNESPESRMRGRYAKQTIPESIRPKTANAKQPQANQFYSVCMRVCDMVQFYVDKGNNSALVRRILSRRSWLYEATTLTTVNIRWKQTSRDFNYATLGGNQIGTQRKISINHLEFHPELTTKTRLFLNLKTHCKKNKDNINDFVPATYLINLDSNTFQTELKDFIDYFCKIKSENILRNVWLLKPPDLNRGQGIQLFNDIRVFIGQLQEYCKTKQNLKSSRVSKPSIKNVIITYPADRSDPQKDANGMTTATFILEQNPQSQGADRVVVLQKYLENPYLYNGRKFDFRVWVLVDHMLYSIYDAMLGKAIYDQHPIHLISPPNPQETNLCIQPTTPFRSIMKRNQLSFSDLQNYFQMKGQKVNVREKIVNRMKELVKITFSSAAERLALCNFNLQLIGNKQYQYEIYGYDFMIDNSSNIWLIEINTNPCIEESSPLLQKLIPRMLSMFNKYTIDDAFRLTLDKIFPPQRQEQIEEILSEFAVPGYNHSDNLWELQGRIGK